MAAGIVWSGRYELLQQLGGNPYLQTYLAFDRKRHVQVVLKLLILSMGSPDSNRFLLQQMNFLTTLQHPHILQVYEISKTTTQIAIVREYAEGKSLAEIFTNNTNKNWDLDWVLSTFIPICHALVYAHGQNIYHAALKPTNIFLDTNGKVWLSDFDLLHFLLPASFEAMMQIRFHYLAPEFVYTKAISKLTDVYAMGVLLYQASCNGKLPFDGNRAEGQTGLQERVIWEARNLPPIPFEQAGSRPFAALSPIISHCLEKNSQERIQTVHELWNRLLEVQNSLRKSTPVSLANHPPLDEVDRSSVASRLSDKPSPSLLWRSFAILGTAMIVVFLIWLTVTLQANRENAEAPRYPTSIITSVAEKEKPPEALPAGYYPLSVCMSLQEKDNIQLQYYECISGLEILPEGLVKVYMTWSVFLPLDHIMEHISDQDNPNMYITDQLGRHYEQLKAGGAAAKHFFLKNGEQAEGWFLFPPFAEDVVYFIFHDDDNQIQTEPIYLHEMRQSYGK